MPGGVSGQGTSSNANNAVLYDGSLCAFWQYNVVSNLFNFWLCFYIHSRIYVL